MNAKEMARKGLVAQDDDYDSEAEHQHMIAAYAETRQRLTRLKEDWFWCVNLDSVEEVLQRKEHELARFEWRHGIFI